MFKLISFMRFFYLFIFLLFYFNVNSQYSDLRDHQKIDPILWKKIEKSGVAEYIILLKDRFSINTNHLNISKEQKANVVYKGLISKARNTQKPILSFLSEQK